jgi:hypothetical protein
MMLFPLCFMFFIYNIFNFIKPQSDYKRHYAYFATAVACAIAVIHAGHNLNIVAIIMLLSVIIIDAIVLRL